MSDCLRKASVQPTCSNENPECNRCISDMPKSEIMGAEPAQSGCFSVRNQILVSRISVFSYHRDQFSDHPRNVDLMIESADPNRVKNFSSFKIYILVFLYLVLSVASIMPYISNFRENLGCEAYFNFAKEYNFPPSSCLQYSLQKYVVPAMATVLPFLFTILVMLFKEKKKEYQLTKSKQEKIAFSLSVFAILTFILSYDLIMGIRCEGFGCLGLAPLIEASVIIFPPLIFGFSLWFLMARYQWRKQKLLAVAIVQIILLIGAYMQTPLF